MRSKAIVGLLALSAALWAATPAKKKSAPKAPAAQGAKSKTASTSKTGSKSKTASASKTASTAGKAKKSSAKTAAARYRRSTQREPAPERYKEIQQSLAEKGYFAGPVNGSWGPDSVEALKRFQRDQNIDDDGKLGSLSLIALGLGPKRGAGDAGERPAGNDPGGPSPP